MQLIIESVYRQDRRWLARVIDNGPKKRSGSENERIRILFVTESYQERHAAIDSAIAWAKQNGKNYRISREVEVLPAKRIQGVVRHHHSQKPVYKVALGEKSCRELET